MTYVRDLTGLLVCFSAISLVVAEPARAQMNFEHVVVDSDGPQNIWGKSVGDLNNDGLPDLIAGGRSGGGLVWYENPSWVRRTIASSGDFSTDHEVCDVDGDGDADVVSLQNALYWYEAPSWVEHAIASTGLHDIEVFDFEGDGDCDVVGRDQGNFGGSGATLYFYQQSSPTSWSRSTRSIPDGEGLASADMDGDGDLDLVLNEVWIQNRGANLGAWTQHTYTTAWNHGAAYVAIADMDGDANPDIVLAPSELAGDSFRISWFEAPGDPTQSAWAEHVVDGAVESVHHFVGAADFDRDGDIDVAAAEMEQGSNPDEVKIYRNDGASFTKVVISNDGSHSMRVVDIDLDGDPDLFGANWESNRVDLYVNQTPANALTLDAWERHVLDANRPGQAIFVAAKDLDGDDRVDVAAGGYWYRNPGTASGSWTRNAFGSPLNNLAVIHDFDGDGDADVLGTEGVGSEAAPDFVFGRNEGQGSFTRFPNVASGSGDFLQGVTVARLGPGEPESVVLSWHAGAPSVEALVVPADPAAGPWSLESYGVAGQDEGVDDGDIDRDGDRDVLLGTHWLDNLGSSFTERTLFQTSDAPDRNRLADIDRDGRLDAVVGYEAISTTGVVAWYRQPSNPYGSWSETVIAQVTGPMSLDVADMDRDGDLDVVVGEHNLSSPSSAGLFVFENVDGFGGSWAQHTVYVGDEHHDGAQVVDIDGDGDLDIVSIGWGHGRVLLYENEAASPDDPGTGGGGGDPTSSTRLLAGWGFEEPSGTVVEDSTASSHDGVLVGGASRSTNGKLGNALETNGQAGHVSITGMYVDSGGLTIMAWINADDFGTPDARIISKSTSSAEQDHVWMLSTATGPRLRFRLRTNGNTSTLVAAGSTLSPGVWIHAAATYDGSTMKLYQDGELVGTLAKSGTIDTDRIVPTWIGANPGATGQVFDGRIDEVRVYSGALNPAEIQYVMTSQLPTPWPDPTCAAVPGRQSQTITWALIALIGLSFRRPRNARRRGK